MPGAEYGGLLRSLAQNARIIREAGLSVELRDCADRVPGRMDPRAAFAASADRAILRAPDCPPALKDNEDHLLGPEQPEDFSLLELHRFRCGWRSADRSRRVSAQRVEVDAPGGPVPVWKYEAAGGGANRPCLLFFHGGGFFAGDVPTVENQCKLLAQLAGAVVLAPDYPLAPEHPYPAGFDACYAAVEWAHANAEALGIDPAKCGVAGDSAGGNLAMACVLQDRDEGSGMVHYAALIYPLLSLAGSAAEPHYCWSPDGYHNPDRDPCIGRQCREIGEHIPMLASWYLPNGADRFHPYASPLAGTVEGLPPILMMVAEYDFLRPQCEEYSRRLAAAGYPHRHIRYGGIVHGTFDRLGYAPQVEDMVREIARDLQQL